MRHWFRALRPLFWWALFVLALYTYRLHQRLSAQTHLTYSVALQGQHVDYETSATLDGHPTTSGDRIPIGWHKFVILHPKADVVSTNLFIWYGTNDLHQIDLKRQYGTLDIQATPPAAVLTIRGEEFSQTLKNSTGINAPVPTGRYSVEATYTHWHETREVEVTKYTPGVYQIAPRLGALSATSRQENATFRLVDPNDLTVAEGKLPAVVGDLPEGRYKLIGVHHGNQQQEDVRIRAGTTNSIEMEFSYGAASVETEPAGAEVLTSDGRLLGKTPITITELVPGHWDLVLRRDGYEDLPVALEIAAKQTSTIHTNLLLRRYVDAMQEARRYLANADCDRAMTAVNEALQAKAGDAAAIALQKQIVAERNTLQIKAARERFDALAANIKEATRRGDGNEAMRAFVEAKKLFPDDPRIAELDSQVAPFAREGIWQAALKTLIDDSKYKKAGADIYAANFTTVKEGVTKVLNAAGSSWKLHDERAVSNHIQIMQLSPRGLLQYRKCLLMVADIGKEQVEIRYSICLYEPTQVNLGTIALPIGVPMTPESMQQSLEQHAKELQASLKRQLDKEK